MNTALLSVQSFQQTVGMGSCGPASLKMVLVYYGLQKTEQELIALCGTTKEMGTSVEALEKVARDFGFNVTIRQHCTLEDIQNYLDKKVPVIVDWFSRGGSNYDDSEVADGHYSVVAGLDQEYIYLQDPEIGKLRKIEREDFMKVWFDFKGKYIDSDDLVVRQIIAIEKK